MRVRSKITFAERFLLEITFAELSLHLSEDDERVGERHVAKVTSADRGSSSGGGAEVDLTAPITLCEEFSAKLRSKLPPLPVFIINFFGRSVHCSSR